MDPSRICGSGQSPLPRLMPSAPKEEEGAGHLEVHSQTGAASATTQSHQVRAASPASTSATASHIMASFNQEVLDPIPGGRMRRQITQEIMGAENLRRDPINFSIVDNQRLAQAMKITYGDDQKLHGHLYYPKTIVDREAEAIIDAPDYKAPEAILSRADKIMIANPVLAPVMLDRSKPIVLYFSGSGAPAEQLTDQVASDFYASNRDCPVVSMNYRGFGRSGSSDLSTESIFQDGEAMLHHVTGSLGYKPDNIILHGYSMGATVAGHLANLLAEQGAKPAAMVFDRPMVSAGQAAAAAIPLTPILGTAARGITNRYYGDLHIPDRLDLRVPTIIITDREKLRAQGQSFARQLEGQYPDLVCSQHYDIDHDRQSDWVRESWSHHNTVWPFLDQQLAARQAGNQIGLRETSI